MLLLLVCLQRVFVALMSTRSSSNLRPILAIRCLLFLNSWFICPTGKLNRRTLFSGNWRWMSSSSIVIVSISWFVAIISCCSTVIVYMSECVALLLFCVSCVFHRFLSPIYILWKLKIYASSLVGQKCLFNNLKIGCYHIVFGNYRSCTCHTSWMVISILRSFRLPFWKFQKHENGSPVQISLLEMGETPIG